MVKPFKATGLVRCSSVETKSDSVIPPVMKGWMVKLEVKTTEEPLASLPTAVTECWPAGSDPNSKELAVAASPPAKSQGKTFSRWRGEPVWVVLSNQNSTKTN